MYVTSAIIKGMRINNSTCVWMLYKMGRLGWNKALRQMCEKRQSIVWREEGKMADNVINRKEKGRGGRELLIESSFSWWMLMKMNSEEAEHDGIGKCENKYTKDP